jgi:uncharacterized protein (TIGR02118 family)
MARMVAIYRTPKNVEAFDRHYFEIHVPLAKKIPGLKKYEVSDGPIATPGLNPSPFCSSRRTRGKNGGEMAGGRLYRS